MKLRQILSFKGIHYLAVRFGWRRLKASAFDEKYRCGDWRFQSEGGGELQTVVARYLRQGDMLILGCGGCSILDGFSDSELKSVLGIDLSKEGIELAKRYSSKKVRFAVADMISYPYDGRYDVILFSESINYVPQSLRESFLARLAGHLKPGGVFVATLAQAQRYREILQSVRRSFLVQEDRTFLGTSRHLIVFSSHNDMKPS